MIRIADMGRIRVTLDHLFKAVLVVGCISAAGIVYRVTNPVMPVTLTNDEVIAATLRCRENHMDYDIMIFAPTRAPVAVYCKRPPEAPPPIIIPKNKPSRFS